MAVLTEDQILIRDAAREWTNDRSPVAALRALRGPARASIRPCGARWESWAGPACWFPKRTAGRSWAWRRWA
jgi:hypothetical protein